MGAGMLVALATLVVASTAPASSHHPKGEFTPFSECPLNRAAITNCIVTVVSSGFFTVGNRVVPIKNPLTLRGGIYVDGSEIKFFGAENGETMSKTPLPIPASVIGSAPTGWPKSIQSWFNENVRNAGVTATIELAGPATSIKLSIESLINEEGVALLLPVKIKLGNPVLGSACYVGSDRNPIVIPLSTGTSGKVRGAAGEVVFNDAFTLIHLNGTRLVDSTFATGTASGCGGSFSGFVNPLVNSIFGASSSGKNSIALEANMLEAKTAVVRENE